MSGRPITQTQEGRALQVSSRRLLSIAVMLVGVLTATSRAENDLALAITDACQVQPGEAITVLLDISNLPQPINGVQAIVSYDPELLMLSQVLPGDGVASPWNSAMELYEQTAGDELLYALVIPAAGTAQDAVVCRLEFVGLARGVVTLELRTASESTPSFVAKLTGYPHGDSITPTLAAPLGLVVTDVGYGDVDGDRDIDIADFAEFEACMTGVLADNLSPEDLPAFPCCALSADGDGDIDLEDFAALQAAFTGLPD